MALKNIPDLPWPDLPRKGESKEAANARRLPPILRHWYNNNPELFVKEVAAILEEAGLLDDEPDVRPETFPKTLRWEYVSEPTEKVGVDDGTRTRDNRNHNSTPYVMETDSSGRVVLRNTITDATITID